MGGIDESVVFIKESVCKLTCDVIASISFRGLPSIFNRKRLLGVFNLGISVNKLFLSESSDTLVRPSSLDNRF
jgi:hypothetical protein